MTKNKREVQLFDLDFSGEYLFIYSDGFNIIIFFFDHEDNNLYKIVTNKYFIVESIDEIKVPSNFREFSSIKFSKPIYDNTGDYIFLGVVKIKDKAYKFQINAQYRLDYTKEIVYYENNGTNNGLKCLESIKVFSCVRKDNRVLLVGYDEYNEGYIFGVVNIKDDKMERVYYLYSDYGDIIPCSVNPDSHEGKVYVVGKIVYKSKSEVSEVKPFFECFNLN